MYDMYDDQDFTNWLKELPIGYVESMYNFWLKANPQVSSPSKQSLPLRSKRSLYICGSIPFDAVLTPEQAHFLTEETIRLLESIARTKPRRKSDIKSGEIADLYNYPNKVDTNKLIRDLKKKK